GCPAHSDFARSCRSRRRQRAASPGAGIGLTAVGTRQQILQRWRFSAGRALLHKSRRKIAIGMGRSKAKLARGNKKRDVPPESGYVPVPAVGQGGTCCLVFVRK